MSAKSGISYLSIDLIGIGNLLSQNFLSVPRYQRSYAWESSHVRDFFQDITAAFERGDQEYFLGSVVMSESSGGFEVVDGQQRLATCSIWLSAIRDYIYETDSEQARDLEVEYLLRRHLKTRESVPKLKMNVSDNEFYIKTILSLPDSEDRAERPVRDSHDRILEARKIAAEHVRNVAKNTSDPVASLLDRLEYLANAARVIYVRVPDHTNAYVIFETLNDRGLDLSTADLLKNHLFGTSDDRIGEVQENWSNMIGTLDTVGGEKLVLTYLRHLWSSINGATREKELYSKIRASINSKQKAIDFSHHLASSARLYAGISNSTHAVWGEFGDSAREFAETLSYLRLEQFRPLLLAVLEKFEKHEVRKVLRLLVACSVRFLVVGGLGGGTMEKVYCDAAMRVRNDEIRTAGELKKELSANVPSDREFSQSFATARVSKGYLARYYLCALERKLRGDNQPEYVPNQNADEVNLEHILPQNPGEGWGDLAADEVHAALRRLGNLTLLRQQINGEVGNESFVAKKQYFAESDFHLNRYFADKEKWTPTEIDERQAEFARICADVWPL